MKLGLLIMIAVALVLLAGGIYFLNQNGNKTADNQNGNAIPDATSSSSDTQQGDAGTSGTPKTYNIDIKGFLFNPSTLRVKVGDTVTWTNEDSASHTVTSDSGDELASGTLSNKKSYSHTFSTKGTFAYHCAIHPSMKANIIVE